MSVKPRPAIDRTLDRCIETSAGCWEFTGALSGGYGVVGLGSRALGTTLTHRLTYTHFIGEVPAGLDLDHLCRNRACCNPWHLDPVPRRVNVARGLRAPGYALRIRTHCKQGHEFTPENTYQRRTQRVCKTCHNQPSRRAA